MLRNTNLIKNNWIEHKPSSHVLIDDANVLYGKPKGTYFFRENDKGQTKLIFSAGGTKIAALAIEEKPDGKIVITEQGYQRSFDSETEFLRIAKKEGLGSPAFPQKHIKLTLSANEFNNSCPSLKYLSALSILKNQKLKEVVYEIDNPMVPEELANYCLKVDDQLDAIKSLESLNKLRK
jgi:hypothetical protein